MALQPINYGAFSGNALGSYFDTMKGYQDLERGDIQNQALQQQTNQQQQAVTRKDQARNQAQEIFKSKSPEQISDFLIENPEYSEIFDAAGGYASPRSKQSKLETARNISLGSNVQEELQKSLSVIQEEGGDPTDTLKMLEQPPENIKDIAESIWASIDPVGHREFRSSNPRGGAEPSLPSGTVEFENLIQNFSPEEQENARKIKAGLKGRAVSNALLSAIESGDVSNLSQANAQIKQAEAFASATGASRAKFIDDGVKSISKIEEGLRNIDDAITAVANGAGVGVINRMFPSIKAASVELDNIRNKLALDVVGSVTFGALSDKELALAKDVALPTGLNSAELTDYLMRKKSAQNKLKDYYNEQIQYLDQGNSVAGFLRKKERQQQVIQEQTDQVQQGQLPAQQVQQGQSPAQQVQTVNWGDL